MRFCHDVWRDVNICCFTRASDCIPLSSSSQVIVYLWKKNVHTHEFVKMCTTTFVTFFTQTKSGVCLEFVQCGHHHPRKPERQSRACIRNRLFLWALTSRLPRSYWCKGSSLRENRFHATSAFPWDNIYWAAACCLFLVFLFLLAAFSSYLSSLEAPQPATHLPRQKSGSWGRHKASIDYFSIPASVTPATTGQQLSPKICNWDWQDSLTLLGLQSRFGGKLLIVWVVCPQNGTAALKGLRALSNKPCIPVVQCCTTTVCD